MMEMEDTVKLRGHNDQPQLGFHANPSELSQPRTALAKSCPLVEELAVGRGVGDSAVAPMGTALVYISSVGSEAPGYEMEAVHP